MNLRYIRYFLAGLILLLANLPLQSGESADAIVRKVQRNYEKIKTLQVNFVQTIYWSLAEEEQKVAGKFYLAGDHKYRVETESQVIVTDGTTVWTYAKDRNQVIINLLAQSKDNPLPRDLLLRYTKDYRARLKGEETINHIPCYKLEFTPRKDDAFILVTRIWVDKKRWLAIKIEQEDINENVTRYELSRFKLNPPLPDALFTFSIADSMDVVDLR